MFDLQGIDHVALAVSDVEASARWYEEVLGFRREHDDIWKGVPLFVAKGQTGIAFFAAHENAPLTGSKRDHVGMVHLAFRASRAEFLRAQEELKEREIAFSFSDHTISHSIYFCDPDGIKLEITTYEIA